MKTVVSTDLFTFAYSKTVKMQATCSTETSVAFQRTTWRYIAEDGTHHNHRGESLNSYTIENKHNAL
jgi:hypothetical protein